MVPTKLCLNVSSPSSKAIEYTSPSPSKNWLSLLPKISRRPGPFLKRVPLRSFGIVPVTLAGSMVRGALPSVVDSDVLR